jgi:hypothetical protein
MVHDMMVPDMIVPDMMVHADEKARFDSLYYGPPVRTYYHAHPVSSEPPLLSINKKRKESGRTAD